MRVLSTLLFVATLAISPHAFAASANVDITGPAAEVDPLLLQLGLSRAELELKLEAEVDALFNLAKPAEYVRALADAQAFSNKGLGVDYASNPTAFVVGLSANLAMGLGDKGLGERYEQRPVVGIAPSVSIMGGLNMGFAGAEWLTIYGNFFMQGLEYEQLTGDILNFGAHAQIKFFRPEGDPSEYLFQWGGFDLTTGFEYSRLIVEMEESLESFLPADADNTAVHIGKGTFDITTTAMTIPFELTTNFRFLYFVTFFGGVGIDVQLGEGSMTVSLDGPLSMPNPAGGPDVNLGEAQVEVTQKAKPTTGKVRFLAGLQANISFVKVFVQGNYMHPNAISAAAGLRIAW